MVEVSVPWALLQEENIISLAFDDTATNTDEFVASAVLQTFSSPIN